MSWKPTIWPEDTLKRLFMRWYPHRKRISSYLSKWLPLSTLQVVTYSKPCKMSVNPKVIDTPPVTAVAKDGIQLIAKARVTVRANIRQLVGGAGEDTILARVGEGIVSSIGLPKSISQYSKIRNSISKLVLRKGLDAGTAFEILSIDIADIDIGKNIGAALQIDQANADKNIAQAKAEERRAMAVASEQENESQSAGSSCESNRSRSRSTESYGRSLP